MRVNGPPLIMVSDVMTITRKEVRVCFKINWMIISPTEERIVKMRIESAKDGSVGLYYNAYVFPNYKNSVV